MIENAPHRPAVRLRPKTGGRFFAGAPWVYNNEIVLDRRTKAIAPGTIADLVDSERQAVATIALHPESRIAGRALAREPGVAIDEDWFVDRLSSARAIRERLYDAPYYRLVHAEADGLPGLIVDRFGDAVVLQPNAAWLERRRDALLAAVDQVLAPQTVVWNGEGRARALEGLERRVDVVKDVLDGPIETPMNGATYFADLAGGQKTGLFYDQRPAQAFVAGLSAGAQVLDVFSHVGGFGLAALAAGAGRATLVDSSAPALTLAEKGAERMGVSERLTTRRGDAFDVMRALLESNERFGVVVCDPPAFAPNRAARDAGLRAYAKTARLGVSLTGEGGVFALCSCSGAVSEDDLREAAGAAFRAARRSARLLRAGGAGPDHPVHPHLPESEYLKTLVFLLD